ncbi:MAG: YhcG family protein, partial [Bacilli bacterium]|nr:YhcG family protein [Bacilli bacterium]
MPRPQMSPGYEGESKNEKDDNSRFASGIPGVEGIQHHQSFLYEKWFLFYVTYGRFEKVQQAAGEFAFPSFFGLIPWMHHVLIITKCRSIEEALFYIKKTIADNLSRSALENCIRADLYHTAGAAVTNFAETLPDAQGKLAQDLLKGNYDFGFVQLAEEHNEYELEDALEKHMTRFLLELGQGWAFVGRQKE